MEMVRICGQSSRPALMCVCSERQWLLWRPIFEHRDIANVVNEQFLFWVQSSDGATGKQGLEAIQHHSSSGMVAVVCNVDGCQKVLRKITESPSVSEFQRLLEEALKEFQEQKRTWLALKAERDLKKEQDLAFAESLKADKEKELRKKNTKGCQCESLLEEIRSEVITTEPPQQECSDEQLQQESNEGQRQENANEPPAKRLRSEGELRIAVVLPDGKRHILDVPLQNTLMDLYQQVRNLLPGHYVSASIALHCPLDSNVTRRLHESSMRIRDLGLESNVVVRVSLNENDANRSQET